MTLTLATGRSLTPAATRGQGAPHSQAVARLRRQVAAPERGRACARLARDDAEVVENHRDPPVDLLHLDRQVEEGFPPALVEGLPEILADLVLEVHQPQDPVALAGPVAWRGQAPEHRVHTGTQPG